MPSAHMVIALFIVLLGSCFGVLHDSIKTCQHISCDPDEGSRPSEPASNYKFMTAGVPQIFWDSVIGNGLNETTFSTICKSQLLTIADAMNKNEEWAYQFIDSSGKTPAGLFRSTLTAIGDYDQCLGIAHDDTRFSMITGKYCMIDMFPIKQQDRSETKLDLSKVTIFRGYPFWNALCLPSGCTEQEIQSSLHILMKPYSIRVNGDISCDTREDLSYLNRLTTLSMKQIIAAVFILAIVSLVLWCTAHHVVNFFLPGYLPHQSELLHSLSILESSTKMFYSKPYAYDILVFDVLKLFVIWTGTWAHLLVNVEAPLSTATMDKHDILNYLFSSPETQSLMNDAGLVLSSFISGAAIFLISYPVAKAGKFSYAFAVTDRLIRFLPAIMCLTALEFLWPLTGSGPFFKRIAAFNLDKCSKNWWLNLLFLNNYFIDGIDICGGHTFSSSVDMQLFFFGIAGLYLYTRSERAGNIFSVIMILMGSIKMALNAITYETTGTLYNPYPSAENIERYFSYITTSMTTFLPAYFMGFLIANGHINSHFPKETIGFWGHVKWLIAISTCQWSQTSMAIAYNSFQLIPHSMAFIVVVWTRTLQVLSVSLFFVYIMTFKESWEQNQKSKQKLEEIHAQKVVGGGGERKECFNLLRGICRLSFSVYMSNYLYIRTEFFTRRVLMHNHLFWMVHRILSSMIMIYATAFAFQVLFVSPLDSIRVHVQKYFRSNQKKAQKTD